MKNRVCRCCGNEFIKESASNPNVCEDCGEMASALAGPGLEPLPPQIIPAHQPDPPAPDGPKGNGTNGNTTAHDEK
ncbi:MAG TPA: hypothetical protein VGF13_02440 [Verrucomicrobiae bacterium]|jgi:hypothetical protein